MTPPLAIVDPPDYLILADLNSISVANDASANRVGKGGKGSDLATAL
jgi:hypothetical protein